MAIKLTDIVLTLIFNVLHTAYAQHILSCNVTTLESCTGENQICSAKTGQCECLDGFTMSDGQCAAAAAAGARHGATAAVVSIFTLALLAAGLFLVIKKYNLIEYVRQKINLRRGNDVMYEDVMIGNDDPPLNP
ncbi:unnamed protein product [Plutella xylostella]|uniref:(diamondback moth) hypothetical protein n=1 Tax=Plutella xylostella TaxID=51655 RepID=A0A8S4G4B8_PLUXY|nr:unnamed protein product [Plutella xylostella]